MIEILAIMASGILIGVLLRGKRVVVAIVERSVLWSIYLLLLLLGVAIGANPVIVSSLPTLGLTALFITLAAILGSILLAALLWRFIFSKPR